MDAFLTPRAFSYLNFHPHSFFLLVISSVLWSEAGSVLPGTMEVSMIVTFILCKSSGFSVPLLTLLNLSLGYKLHKKLKHRNLWVTF